MDSGRLAVIALGGNAIAGPGMDVSVESQTAAVKRASSIIADVLADGWRSVITHGNGPQVGYLSEAFEALPPERPRQPLYIATAMTQAWIGLLLKHSLEEELRRRGLNVLVPVVISRVLVDVSDPSFNNPSKPVGPIYGREEAEELSRRYGWVFKRDPRGGFRRVVPSPRPVSIVDRDLIAEASAESPAVVALGGGGVPVVERPGGVLEPVEAVVDKDLASSLLATQLNADLLVILTDVPGVAVNYGREGERWLRRAAASELKKYLREGHFPPGSMGPKVEAAISFVERTGKPAVIGSLEEARQVLSLQAGTVVMLG
ncbi:carbamate kinase [Aeropyrum pernix K1]|uniref:Carbamate kinase n=1 Tax=Aeropyrum pernix (strain ATCC 700893 / DSM 11879 / JCM 9820 / NBRC 100138 / K1) TaxID=272557 RepID=Q9YAH1_AERPE|nr:carbamate kinase [Aeropyrum pernix]2E9Y_A Chain A, Carbamate kinase [Aeropyrum pernix K1]2E9Y_B Chain B, Carbamate kinase [Aeropyrum pernix K1]BAA80978.1 carbamate kinase [Aeropyrum pernix K1]